MQILSLVWTQRLVVFLKHHSKASQSQNKFPYLYDPSVMQAKFLDASEQFFTFSWWCCDAGKIALMLEINIPSLFDLHRKVGCAFVPAHLCTFALMCVWVFVFVCMHWCHDRLSRLYLRLSNCASVDSPCRSPESVHTRTAEPESQCRRSDRRISACTHSWCNSSDDALNHLIICCLLSFSVI